MKDSWYVTLPSDHVIEARAYLVDQGERPLALLDLVNDDRVTIQDSKIEIQRGELAITDALLKMQEITESYPGAIAFVVPEGDQYYTTIGFAAAPWVASALMWLLNEKESEHFHEISHIIPEYVSLSVVRYFRDEITNYVMKKETGESS